MHRSLSMDQPLWQIWLNVAMIGFVAQRAAIGIALRWDQLSPLLRGAYIGLFAACAFAAVAVWMSARWVICSLSVLAAVFVLTTLAELSHGVSQFTSWLGLQLVVALAGLGVLIALAWRKEQKPLATVRHIHSTRRRARHSQRHHVSSPSHGR